MDWGLNEYFEPVAAEPARPERELVPDGRHAFKVERASEEGSTVKVALSHDDRRYGWVWCRMRQDHEIGQRIAASLRTALGMSPDEWKRSAIDDIVGRHVEAEIYHQVKGETTYVNVRRFHAVEEPAALPPAKPVAKPAARTTTKKADAVGRDPDDIPF